MWNLVQYWPLIMGKSSSYDLFLDKKTKRWGSPDLFLKLCMILDSSNMQSIPEDQCLWIWVDIYPMGSRISPSFYRVFFRCRILHYDFNSYKWVFYTSLDSLLLPQEMQFIVSMTVSPWNKYAKRILLDNFACTTFIIPGKWPKSQ